MDVDSLGQFGRVPGKMATSVLPPVKTDDQILHNSMLEDDPNDNSATNEEEKTKPRWGPYHKGAKELAGLYSRGESQVYQTGVVVVVCEAACLPACRLPDRASNNTLITSVILNISLDHEDCENVFRWIIK